MRVLHVIEGMHRGGAERVVIEHVRHAGADVTSSVCAINRGGPALDACAALGAGVRVLRRGRESPPATVRALAALIRHERPDVVNGHNPTGALYGTLAARAAGVRCVVRTEHSVHRRGRHSRAYATLEPTLTWLSDAVLCVADAVRESHVARMPWAARRFVTVPNGIGPPPPVAPREDTRAALGVAPDAPLIVSVGSLTPAKRPLALVEAMPAVLEAHPTARLLLVGEGPLRPGLEDAIDAGGLRGRVVVLGDRGDVPDLLAAADAFALTSDREGLSMSVLEAMRAALPVVATDVGGNREAVADGVTGVLVAAHAPAAVGPALAALLLDPARARAMGAEGRRRWAARFTAERMVRDTERIYAGLPRAAAARGLATGQDAPLRV